MSCNLSAVLIFLNAKKKKNGVKKVEGCSELRITMCQVFKSSFKKLA